MIVAKPTAVLLELTFPHCLLKQVLEALHGPTELGNFFCEAEPWAFPFFALLHGWGVRSSLVGLLIQLAMQVHARSLLGHQGICQDEPAVVIIHWCFSSLLDILWFCNDSELLLQSLFSAVPWPCFFVLDRIIKQESLILSLFVTSQFMVKRVYHMLPSLARACPWRLVLSQVWDDSLNSSLIIISSGCGL